MQGKPIDVRIKWPNDLYAGPLKLGGILCHSSYRDQLFHIVIGVSCRVAGWFGIAGWLMLLSVGCLWCEGRTRDARRGQGFHHGMLFTMCAGCVRHVQP